MASIDGKRLRELTDEELERELQRRRRSRGMSREAEAVSSHTNDRPGWKIREELRRWYRALELKPGSSLDDVERSYKELLNRYDPDQHSEDPEKHRLAKRLAAGLGEAYYGLRDHLSG